MVPQNGANSARNCSFEERLCSSVRASFVTQIPRKLVFKLETGGVMLGALRGPCLEWVMQPAAPAVTHAWDEGRKNI